MSQFKTIKDNAIRLYRQIIEWLVSLSAVLLLSACAMHANDLVPDHDKVGVTVSAVGHYGSMIGIPEYSIDGFHAGNNSGWGGGGSTSCCVLLPRAVTKPVFATVKWETYRSNVDEERKHEATVPIHFAVQPGKGGCGLFAHFLPGHRVELWYASPCPESAQYPGPQFPFGPAPSYAPLSDEKSSATPNDNHMK